MKPSNERANLYIKGWVRAGTHHLADMIEVDRTEQIIETLIKINKAVNASHRVLFRKDDVIELINSVNKND